MKGRHRKSFIIKLIKYLSHTLLINPMEIYLGKKYVFHLMKRDQIFLIPFELCSKLQI